MAWDIVTHPKDGGVLEINNSQLENKCLLGKFYDKLLCAPTTLWEAWFYRMYDKVPAETWGLATSSTPLSGDPSLPS